ncbi:MAG: ATP-binding protein [Eubacterium sp.]|nr:ATP-binding protein [Eubacterium sp.]
MGRTIAIGEQNFARMIEHRYFYVDKTAFIKEWWENGDTVTLIARPRRFGKTLAMHMLYAFFSVDYAGRSDLFQNLDIWKEETYRQLQGTYPVLFLSFAGVKGKDYSTVRKKICQLIVNMYMDHDFLMDSGILREEDVACFKRMLTEMDDADAAVSIGQLSRYLYKYYGKKVLILLDEYDTPMQEAYVNGYWRELTEFLRGIFHAALKANPYLERAVMTGITRISKESVFSELNNLAVVTATSRKYATAFGFTEEEVFQALEEFGLSKEREEVKRWYDGFRFGDCCSIYNPWSITQYLDEKVFAAYWANTSSNKLVGTLIQQGSKEMKMAVEDLLRGNSFCTKVDEQIVFDELDGNSDAVWSLLLASGYLKITGYETEEPGLGREGLLYRLALTNLEIVLIFRKLIRGWFEKCSSAYNDFIKALLLHDVRRMNAYMNEVALSTISFFDSGSAPSKKTEPERFYHGFVLGLMVDLDSRYRITSNRESGFGRYDMLLMPRRDTDDGIIFEFKVFDAQDGEKTLEDTAAAAIGQILEKGYADVLQKVCAKDKIRIYGFAFRGKEVRIDGGFYQDYAKIGEG